MKRIKYKSVTYRQKICGPIYKKYGKPEFMRKSARYELATLTWTAVEANLKPTLIPHLLQTNCLFIQNTIFSQRSYPCEVYCTKRRRLSLSDQFCVLKYVFPRANRYCLSFVCPHKNG